MKATDVFKDKKFIECLKERTYGINDRKIDIFNEKNEIIEENIDKVVTINCYKCWITNIEGIHIFKNLDELKLSDNQIEELPEEIGELKKLKWLYLPYNNLQSLPKEIGNLENLEELDLNFNKIKELPSEIAKLKNLVTLNLENNKLQWLPKEIVELVKSPNLIWLCVENAFDFKNLKQNPKELLNILEQLKWKNGLDEIIKDLEEELNKLINW